MSIYSKIKARCIEDANGCWVWQGKKAGKGYGQIRHEGRDQYVHRLMYARAKGLIPGGLQIDHLCRNRRCCNPTHLEAVTCKENLRRGLGNGNKEKTHCPHGHLLPTRNKQGRRPCRECDNAGHRRRYRERQAQDSLRLHGPV